MSEQALIFRIGGDLTIDNWVEASVRFSKVLVALGEKHNARVTWRLAGLEYGSAAAKAEPIPHDTETEQLLPRIRDDYVKGASRVERGDFDSEDRHLRRIQELTEIASESNPITFETTNGKVVFLAPTKVSPDPHPEKTTTSLGTVRGRVETLSHRKGLRFSLYELVTDRAVYCYFDPELEERMRTVWGNIADVHGAITRDAASGKPLRIRDITRIEVIKEGDPMGYLQARGAFRSLEPAEVALRRFRDAESTTARLH